MSDDTLEANVMELGPQDRARLAGKLVLSLDAPPDEENLPLWVAEAERRLAELRADEAREVPAHQLFRRARAASA